jgi:hypothetical protein
LAVLQKAAEDRFNESVRAGQSEGVLGQQAAQAAIPATQQIFANARTSGERGRNLVAPILAALAPDSPFKAAAANEQAAGTERLGQSESHALSDLQQRSVAASELPAYTRQSAVATLLGELQKISSKRSLLQGSEGADQAAEVGKMRAEAGRNALTARGQDLTHAAAEAGHETSEDNSERVAASKAAALAAKGPTGAAKPLTQKQQNEAASVIAQIRQYAGADSEATRAERVAALTSGRPEQSKKNEKGETVKIPARPAFKPDARMSAALDYAEYGHLTRATERRLQQAGYDPSRLGVPPAPKEPSYSQSTGLHSRAHMG